MERTHRDGGDPLDAAIGRRMAELRTAAGRSQETVAARLGVSQNTVSRWENGTIRLPPLSVLGAYADLVGVTLTDVLAPALDGQRPALTDEQRRLAELLRDVLGDQEGRP
jgi:transcriptional regulator with XRE-family HTH domain